MMRALITSLAAVPSGLNVNVSCLKGELAWARAAELPCLSVRQIERLKKRRMREDGEAALA
ncbi:MAG: hypothetical protein WCD49_18085, partial [Candidatus Acidiferrales bacterium]